LIRSRWGDPFATSILGAATPSLAQLSSTSGQPQAMGPP
jgi:hypothetical protein